MKPGGKDARARAADGFRVMRRDVGAKLARFAWRVMRDMGLDERTRVSMYDDFFEMRRMTRRN